MYDSTTPTITTSTIGGIAQEDAYEATWNAKLAQQLANLEREEKREAAKRALEEQRSCSAGTPDSVPERASGSATTGNRVC